MAKKRRKKKTIKKEINKKVNNLSLNKFNLKLKISKYRFNLGHFIFALGILLVVLFALSNPTQLTVNKAVILLVLGFLVGLLDVHKEETQSFLLAALSIILLTAAPIQIITYYKIGPYLKAMIVNASVFLTLAVIIVALKVIYRIYKKSKVQ